MQLLPTYRRTDDKGSPEILFDYDGYAINKDNGFWMEDPLCDDVPSVTEATNLERITKC